MSAEDNHSPSPTTTTPDQDEGEVLLIGYNWHHAVNSQSKLDDVINFVNSKPASSDGWVDGDVEAIEADIIHSGAKSRAVMGHPPSIGGDGSGEDDSDLTLASLLEQLRQTNFQHMDLGIKRCPVLKLDFKSMAALESGLADVKEYLSRLPACLNERVWINADILPGPGEDLGDCAAQRKMRPKFDAREFLRAVTTELPGTVLSIGWTTSLTDVRAEYTTAMVKDMIECARPHPRVTFPVRGSCFRRSWETLKVLYETNPEWTLTLWWSRDELPRDEFDWMLATLEGDDELRNRTYYDLAGFRNHLSMRGIR